MADFDIALNIRDANGNLVLALEDEANGYWVRGEGLPAEERRWNRNEAASPWVDGAVDVSATLARTEASVLVKVFGSTWAQVEQRMEALRAALGARSWLLEQVVEGVTKTWRAGPVDILVPPVSTMDLANRRRFVVLTFPVQPTPTVAGV